MVVAGVEDDDTVVVVDVKEEGEFIGLVVVEVCKYRNLPYPNYRLLNIINANISTECGRFAWQ